MLTMKSDRNRPKGRVEKKVLGTVRQTISDHKMLVSGDSVLIAVSGGQDSVTLVHVLHTLSAEYHLRLAVAHLNHCLRGKDSDRDAEFVTDLARKLDLPCYIEKADVRRLQKRARLSLEEAGRKIRYGFFKEIANRYGFTRIALGHHSNDNAELVLMNLLRGSGPLGLSGIIPVREGNIIRPLIHLKRSEIVDYITEKKLPFVTDTSNLDISYRRNRIRHHLIPELEKSYNPAIIDTLNRLGTIMRDEDQWLDSILDREFGNCISLEGPDKVSIELDSLKGVANAAGRRLVRKAILAVKKDLRRITLSHIDAILALMNKSPAKGSLNLPDGIRAILMNTELIIGKNVSADDSAGSGESGKVEYQYNVSVPGVLFLKEAGATLKLTEIESGAPSDLHDAGANLALFDMDRIRLPLVVRNPRPGDRFSPLGLDGTQKVKKYFIDHKIPASQRRLCPLLLSGDKIIWIAGHRIDNCAKVVSTTTRILKAELLLA